MDVYTQHNRKQISKTEFKSKTKIETKSRVEMKCAFFQICTCQYLNLTTNENASIIIPNQNQTKNEHQKINRSKLQSTRKLGAGFRTSDFELEDATLSPTGQRNSLPPSIATTSILHHRKQTRISKNKYISQRMTHRCCGHKQKRSSERG